MKQPYYHSKEGVSEYIQLAKDVDGKRLIHELKSHLESGSSLLELGSGPGKDWEILKDDYLVTGSDNSPEFIKHLESKFPGGQFHLLDAVSLEIDEQFDCIYSNKVLHHLTDEELQKSISKQAEILTPSGIVSHSFWAGQGDEIFKGMYVNYHTIEELEKSFKTHFEIIQITPYTEFEKNDSLHLIARLK